MIGACGERQKVADLSEGVKEGSRLWRTGKNTDRREQ